LGSSAAATVNIPVWNWAPRKAASNKPSCGARKPNGNFRSRSASSWPKSSLSTREADTALNELSGLSRSAELSAESLRLITLRYKGGEATVLEVVDAQTTFAQANTAYQDGAVLYRVALANLQT